MKWHGLKSLKCCLVLSPVCESVDQRRDWASLRLSLKSEGWRNCAFHCGVGCLFALRSHGSAGTYTFKKFQSVSHLWTENN